MNNSLEICLGITITFALVLGIRRYAILDGSSKIILLLAFAGLLFELASFYKAQYSDATLMNIYSAVYFLLISFYFNYTIDIFIRTNLGAGVGLAGLLLSLAGIVNSRFSYYMVMLDGLCVVAMCFVAFYRLLALHEDLRILRYPHFWFTSLILFYWSVTYFIRSYYTGTAPYTAAPNTPLVTSSLKLINMVTYAGIGCVFLLYKKKFTAHE